MRVNEQFCKSLDKNNPSYINHGWGAKPIDFEPSAILYYFSEIFKCFVKKYNFFSHRNVYSNTQPRREPIPSHILIKRGV